MKYISILLNNFLNATKSWFKHCFMRYQVTCFAISAPSLCSLTVNSLNTPKKC